MTLEKAKEIIENEISNICDKELSKAWDTVLKASEDSIPKEKVRKKIKELKSIEPRDDEYNYDLQNEVGFKLDVLNELLGG